jgi:sugar phosphate isomerase/epimerase
MTETKISRREFAVRAAGAAAGLAASRSLLAAGAGKIPPSVVGGLDIGVQGYTFRAFDLDKMIDAMRSVGLSSIEFWMGHLDPEKATETDYRAAKAKLDAAGIHVSAYCVNFKPDASDALLDAAFKGAGYLGTSQMTTSTEKSIVPKLDDWAQKYDVTIGLHNHWLGDSWFHGDKAQNFGGPDDFAEGLKGRSPHIAINLDIGHFSAAGYDPVSYFREHHARINSLHVKDRDKDAQHTNVHFGHGATPIKEVLKLAQELKFQHAVNIEWENDEKNPTPGVQDSFDYIKRVMA